MRTKQGFISNSSSTSFIIDKEKLTQKQIKTILDLPNYCRINNIPIKDWQIDEYSDIICGSSVLGSKTELEPFFSAIKLKENIEWVVFP